MNLKNSLRVALILLTLVLVPRQTFGEELGTGATRESSAHLTLTQKNDPTDPNNGGPLSIVRVSQIEFGEQVMSGDDKTYLAKYRQEDHSYDKEGAVIQGVNYPSYIQIDDSRGTNVGWQLYVKNDGFTEANGKINSNGENDLKGATLTIRSKFVQTKTVGNKPQSELKTISLGNDGYHLLVSALKDEGMGMTDTLFGEQYEPNDVPKSNPDVSLTIPGSSAKIHQGQYVSTMTWLLINDPSV